eukprot:TRINITY_DN12893_c0_g1_i2.p2 TRINITY_DN12893_c0_g1~~TRINITY_DN12893_c0_g1_i2.p2  ORF type:complete len:107 (-),score=17.00 TRINITY_DN12893_c0_g1_i2:188-508(-)
MRNHTAIVRELLKHSPRLDMRNAQQKRAQDYAKPDSEIAQMLQEYEQHNHIDLLARAVTSENVKETYLASLHLPTKQKLALQSKIKMYLTANLTPDAIVDFFFESH